MLISSCTSDEASVPRGLFHSPQKLVRPERTREVARRRGSSQSDSVLVLLGIVQGLVGIVGGLVEGLVGTGGLVGLVGSRGLVVLGLVGEVMVGEVMVREVATEVVLELYASQLRQYQKGTIVPFW